MDVILPVSDTLVDDLAHIDEDTTSSKPSGGEKGKSKRKEKKNVGRRSRGTRVEGPRPEGEGHSKEPRLPKRMCALLLGFCGSGYRGMQFQVATIEGTLFDALVRAGAISKDNSDDPVKVNLQRAARTDAGVHAAGNVVSLKMIPFVPGQGDMLTRINEELPPDIRVWDFVRTKNSFNARLLCDSRKYTYFFPSYLLIPPKPGSALFRNIEQYTSTLPSGPVSPAYDFWTNLDLKTLTLEEELRRKRSWRATSVHLERLRTTAKRYEGTHNFHNFTVARNPKDGTNKRYMKVVDILDPQTHGDTEWIPVVFHGQSFMLHQRKMMFALVMSCRTATPDNIINELYSLRRMVIPKMPALGLLLECPIYDVYNMNVVPVNQNLESSDPSYRPPIDFAKQAEKMAEFKQKFIYTSMRRIEDRKGLFDAWVRSVDAYAGKDLLYYNPEGTIPDVSVIKDGERRLQPFKERKIFNRTDFEDDEEGKVEIEDEEGEEEDVRMDKKTLEEMEG
ncbi:pseudouridine synthase [Guyanagaster necrorhizus]|uniref:Pseudouridine synthase n=1 Tax=Guyanagaster necrorhizus TaxID=856835 RepID=A0A9P8ARA8_9AGAR|nr:pseudouridine synthase [Guyanagaster necrorhizus MCA 3950]KAG7444890.1 pseudouridine synthase [Guyanagaster necrorhizus MCA 3950]